MEQEEVQGLRERPLQISEQLEIRRAHGSGPKRSADLCRNRGRERLAGEEIQPNNRGVGIVFWNVAGLRKKKDDSKFWDYIKRIGR